MAAKKKKKSAGLNTVSPMFNDKKYQEEDDARTLARAHEITSDKKRYKGATAGAKRMVADETKRLSGLKKVARRKAR